MHFYAMFGQALKFMEDGSAHILSGDGSTGIVLRNGGVVKILGNIAHDGEQTSTGTITSEIDCISDTISGVEHVHPEADDAPNPTGAPQ